MYPQNFPGLPVEQNLQHTHGFAGNLRPRQILEERLADIVWHFGFGQFALGFTNRADFRNGINAGRHVVHKAEILVLGNVRRGRPPLVVSGTGQAWPANHIAGSIDMLDFRAVMLVYRQLAPAVRCQAHVLKPQILGIAATAITPQEGIGPNLLAGLQ